MHYKLKKKNNLKTQQDTSANVTFGSGCTQEPFCNCEEGMMSLVFDQNYKHLCC